MMLQKLALLLAFSFVVTFAQEEVLKEESALQSADASEATTAKPTREELKRQKAELKRQEREKEEAEAKEKAVSTAAASKEAQSAAEVALADFTAYIQKLEAQSNDESQVGVVAKEISLQAESQVHKDRDALKADYKAAVAALQDAIALGNSSHVLKKLAKKCDALSSDILKLGKEKAKLERKTFTKTLKQAKKEADKMGHAVEKAAHAGLKAAHQAESAARKARQNEDSYESQYDRAEETMQAIEDGADRLADLADGVLEEFYGRVEHVVENKADGAKDFAQSEAGAREEQVSVLLAEALKAQKAAEKAAEKAQKAKEKAEKAEEAQKKAADKDEAEEKPTTFLFAAQAQPHPFTSGVAVALVAFMALGVFAAKQQLPSRQVGLQRPILG